MTEAQIKAFYKDLGEIVSKHKMSGLAGVWFSGEGHDEMGQLKFWDISDFRMKWVIEDIADKYERWAKHTIGHVPQHLGSIHDVSGDSSEGN